MGTNSIHLFLNFCLKLCRVVAMIKGPRLPLEPLSNGQDPSGFTLLFMGS